MLVENTNTRLDRTCEELQSCNAPTWCYMAAAEVKTLTHLSAVVVYKSVRTSTSVPKAWMHTSEGIKQSPRCWTSCQETTKITVMYSLKGLCKAPVLTFFPEWQPNPVIPEAVKDSHPCVSVRVPRGVHTSIAGLRACVDLDPSASAASELMTPSGSGFPLTCPLNFVLYPPPSRGLVSVYTVVNSLYPIPASTSLSIIIHLSFYKPRLQHWDYSNNFIKQMFNRVYYFSVKKNLDISSNAGCSLKISLRRCWF